MQARSRQKRQGLALVQCLRFDRFFVLLATHGDHPFFAAEDDQVRDVSRPPRHQLQGGPEQGPLESCGAPPQRGTARLDAGGQLSTSVL